MTPTQAIYDANGEELPEVPYKIYRTVANPETVQSLLERLPEDARQQLREKIYASERTEAEYFGELALRARRFDLVEMVEVSA